MSKQQFVLMTTPFRSGSALISRILNSHSQIAITADKMKFFRFCYNRYLPLNEENVKNMLNGLTHRLSGRFNIQIDAQECFERINQLPLCHASIYSTLLQQFYKSLNKHIIGELESLSWTKIPIFLNMFPNGKALLIIRDLRDVVVSFKKSTISPGNDYLIALFNVIDAMDHFLEYQVKYSDRFYGIRFEALKANPEEVTKNICQFLGVTYEPGMLNEENWTEYYNNGWNPWENRQTSSFYNESKHLNPVGRWRSLISKEDLFLCEWIGKKQMEAFGIKMEGEPVSQDEFNLAIEKITSSPLLRECFKHWCLTGKGVERYPVDPLDPRKWDKNYIANPNAFGIESK